MEQIFYENELINNINELILRSDKLFKNRYAYSYLLNNEMKNITYGQLKQDIEKMCSHFIHNKLKNFKVAF